jgi:hypothetical protein
MKSPYIIRIGKEYITISPKPKKTVKNGLKAYLQNLDETYKTMPTITTDIFKNKSRYRYQHIMKHLPNLKCVKAVIRRLK